MLASLAIRIRRPRPPTIVSIAAAGLSQLRKVRRARRERDRGDHLRRRVIDHNIGVSRDWWTFCIMVPGVTRIEDPRYAIAPMTRRSRNTRRSCEIWVVFEHQRAI
jgi:hypothetical protein